jgi:hypothetical protein
MPDILKIRSAVYVNMQTDVPTLMGAFFVIFVGNAPEMY